MLTCMDASDMHACMHAWTRVPPERIPLVVLPAVACALDGTAAVKLGKPVEWLEGDQASVQRRLIKGVVGALDVALLGGRRAALIISIPGDSLLLPLPPLPQRSQRGGDAVVHGGHRAS